MPKNGRRDLIWRLKVKVTVRRVRSTIVVVEKH